LISPISLLAVAPLVLILVILTNPNGIVATIFSLIPFSAPITMVMRLTTADVPPWQIVLSLLLLVLAVIGVVLLSARVMRLGMLRYGKRLSLREMLAG
jgi:ABC-2 type transport system permease protein